MVTPLPTQVWFIVKKKIMKKVKILTQGANANKTGRVHEEEVASILKNCGNYQEVDRNSFDILKSNGVPIFARQYSLKSHGLYSKKRGIRCDFILYHPEKHPNGIVIEAKYQKFSGSVDQKIVYLVKEVKSCYGYGTILVFDGDGFADGMYTDFLPNELGGNFLSFYKIEEFKDMCKEGII